MCAFYHDSLGQVLIYVSVRANSLSTTFASSSTGPKTQDISVARRLVSVALSDFVCWFPIGLLGILSANGYTVSGEVNVAMAVLALPLNSALNPFLYTLNVILERRREKREERLVAIIHMRMNKKQQSRQRET